MLFALCLPILPRNTDSTVAVAVEHWAVFLVHDCADELGAGRFISIFRE
jgi:hypothetical protein